MGEVPLILAQGCSTSQRVRMVVGPLPEEKFFIDNLLV
jgi:hypothetical protein